MQNAFMKNQLSVLTFSIKKVAQCSNWFYAKLVEFFKLFYGKLIECFKLLCIKLVE